MCSSNVYESIQRAFPGAQTPARVVVSAHDVTSPDVQRGIAELKREALASGQTFEPISTEVNPARTVETVSISLQGNGSNGASVTALHTLRDRVIPATVGGVAGVDTAVTGETAGTHDFNQQVLGAKPPRHVPEWLGRLVAGEQLVSMMTEARGASNAKAKRELGWRLVYPS